MFDPNQSAFVSLRNIVSERTKALLVWVGSGLSVPAGLPTWKGLRDCLCKVLEEKARTLDSHDGDRMMEKLRRIQSEKNFWIAFDMLKAALGNTTYKSVIREALSPADRAEVPEIYELIWMLRPQGVLNLNLDGTVPSPNFGT